MAISLSATTDRLSKQAFAEVRTLMKVDFTKPFSTTFRFSDQYLANCGATEWLPLVLDWGEISESVDLIDVSVSPATASVTLNNAVPVGARTRISDYIYTAQNTRGTYEWANAKVTIYQALSPTAAAADLVTIGVYYMEEPQDIGQDVLRLRMSDLSLVIEDKLQLYQINTTDLPVADPGVLDRYVPVIFGDFDTAGKKVSALPVVAGKRCALTATLTSSATTITVDSTTGFSTTGDLMIENEIISYTGLTATTFTGATRGASSSTAAQHAIGVAVFEARSGTAAYRYIVGANILGGMQSLGTVYTNGVAVANSAATTTLAVTTLVSGRSFAMIDFDVTDVGQFHLTPSGARTYAATGTPATTTGFGGTGPNDVNVSGGSAPNYGMAGSWNVTATVSVLRTAGTAPSSLTVKVVDGLGGVFLFATLTSYNDEQVTGTVNIGNYYIASTLGIRFQSADGNMTYDATVHSVVQEFVSSGGGSSSTALAVIGDVTCLVKGTKDDGSGTISGSASLLLENPTDITKAIVTQLYGTSPGIVIGDAGSTWAVTRAKHATLAAKWACVLDFMGFSTLRTECMRHGRSLLYFAAGSVEWKYLDDGPSADHTLVYASDVDAEAPARIRRSDRTRVRNKLTIKSQIDPSTGAYARSVIWQDLTQSGLADPLPVTFELPWVQDTTTADGLGRFWRDQWKRPRLEIDLLTWWLLIGLQIGDVIQFTDHTLLKQHGGAGMTFRVTSRSFSPSRGLISVGLREAAKLFHDRECFAQAFTDEPRAVPGLIPIQYANLERTRARRDPSEHNNVYGGRNRLLSAMGA